MKFRRLSLALLFVPSALLFYPSFVAPITSLFFDGGRSQIPAIGAHHVIGSRKKNSERGRVISREAKGKLFASTLILGLSVDQQLTNCNLKMSETILFFGSPAQVNSQQCEFFFFGTLSQNYYLYFMRTLSRSASSTKQDTR